MYDKLKALNPRIKFYKTSDKEFEAYGKRTDNISATEFINAATHIEMPQSECKYIPSVAEFENAEAARKTEKVIFGETDIQIGYCYGHSNRLNAAEWHKSSEVNVAVTPLVLILGRFQDIVDGKIDSSKLVAFYVEKGEVLEIYANTLHYCPCEVTDSGFGMIVALPTGTNIPLDGEPEDKRLFRKNKWIISHIDNAELISRGVVAGITGENYTIIYK